MGSMIMGLLTGAAFGVVLYKVGATRSERVIGMLLFRDSKVMKFAFTSIATAALVYGLADLAGVAAAWRLTPRVMPYLSGAHLLGGLLFGIAFGFSGLCPGTVVCRAGGQRGVMRVGAAFAVVGLFAGIGLYALIKEPLAQVGLIAAPKPLTLHGALGVPFGPAAVVVGVFFLLLSIWLDRFTREGPPATPAESSFVGRLRGEWHWLPAGVLGGGIVLWATSQGGYLGYSGSALALHGWAADRLGHTSALVPRIDDTITWRAMLLVGALAGGLFAALWSRRPALAAVAAGVAPGSSLQAFGAGVGLGLGAMIGGGCTTGAFIAGFPTLSLGSFAMGGTFFAVGVATAALRARFAERARSVGGHGAGAEVSA